jgi:hypothetical protein
LFCFVSSIVCFRWIFLSLSLLNADSNDGDGEPQFWQDIRAAITEEDTKNLLEALMDVDDAP